jgi:hypothetical protein
MKCVIPGLNVKGNGKFVSETKINIQFRLCMKFDYQQVLELCRRNTDTV